jgi:hypothetical protein
MRLNHIGLQTKSVRGFEEVWCDALGFIPAGRRRANRERVNLTFNTWVANDIEVLLYTHPDSDLAVELHIIKPLGRETGFEFVGVNHIALHTGSKGSRQKILQNLPEDITVNRYNNPRGWENITIVDRDGNYIELYEWL